MEDAIDLLRIELDKRCQSEAPCPFQTQGATGYRHADSDKWFGLLMLVKGEKLDVSNADKADEYLPILDVKCEPLLVEHLVERPGYLRAYHMNKKQWISVFLDGTVSFNEVKQALDQSYELTK